MKESGDETLEGYLANVALYTDMDNYDKEADCVVMMTMHSAKGLEFPSVFIVGMEEGIFPGIRAIGEQDEDGGGAAAVLCGPDPGQGAAAPGLRPAAHALRTHHLQPVSRFVDEIPEEHIKKNIPRGYGYGERAVSRPSLPGKRRDRAAVLWLRRR